MIPPSRYIGLDLGTSGVRAVLTEGNDEIVAEAQTALPPPEGDNGERRQNAALWWDAVDRVMQEIIQLEDTTTVAGICVDGTSGTILVCDLNGEPLAPARMYNDRSAVQAGGLIDTVAPAKSMARGTGGSLARLLALLEEVGDAEPTFALHQADWIAARLTGSFGASDHNNCLKLGYDVARQCWPNWMSKLGFDLSLLPEVSPPGTPLANVSWALMERYSLPPDCQVLQGTTDGNAAFLAAGAFEPGNAVTSLGTTLTLKLVSEAPVFAPEYGVYSHKLLGHWLAGGASNSGGAAIASHFSLADIERLTPSLKPETPSGLDYYPLPAQGERFPVADPELTPRVSPRPDDDATFLQGLLEGIAHIERDAYARLAALGATPVRQVTTVGGGAANKAWARIRERVLGVPVTRAANPEAAFGAARLARLGLERG